MGIVDNIFNPIKKGFTKDIKNITNGVKKEGDKLLGKIAKDIGNPLDSINNEFKKIPDKVLKPIDKFIKKSIRDPILDLIDGIDVMIANFIRIVCFIKTTPNRFRNLGSAFDEVFNGVAQEFVALGYAFELGFDSISSLVYYSATFIESYLSCGIKLLSNSLDCLPFYLIDITGQIIYIPVRIILWAFYTFLKLDLYSTEKSIWETIMVIDSYIFKTIGLHIAAYPKHIRENCYTCIRLKSSVIKNKKKDVDNTFNKKIPNVLGKSKPTFDKSKRHFDEVFAYPISKDPKNV